MKTRLRSIATLLFTLVTLAGCASVDQFGSRIYDANINSQNALDQETLLNILRASRFQNPNFVAITQITGGQTEMETAGFPTFTTGPHAAPTVITNALTSGLSGSYQSNPLVSSQFEEGILSPVTPRIVAQLIKSEIREPVFYTVIDNIRMRVDGRLHTFFNDPSDDVAPTNSVKLCRDLVPNWNASVIFRDDRECRYSKFKNFLDKLFEFGISAELVDQSPSPAQKATGKPTSSNGSTDKVKSNDAPSGSTAANKDIAGIVAPGQFCFDPAEGTRYDFIAGLRDQQCGEKHKADPKLIVHFVGARAEIEQFSLRSLAQMYSYLGKIERFGTSDRVLYYTLSGSKILPTGAKFLDIRHGVGVDCAVAVVFELRPYCVPSDADNTRMIFSILQQVRNLRIQPSDLNSAFTVRLSNP